MGEIHVTRSFKSVVARPSKAISAFPSGPRCAMAPRTVLAPGYTGWCVACLRSAVGSNGGHRQAPPEAPRGTPPHGRRELHEDDRTARVTATLHGVHCFFHLAGVEFTSRTCSPWPVRSRGSACTLNEAVTQRPSSPPPHAERAAREQGGGRAYQVTV